MQRRFTIIRGGLSEAGRDAAEWRVAVRRALSLDEPELAAWRALNGRSRQPDPFADPDVLVSAARHAPQAGGGIAFALAYAVLRDGQERLAGVLPLELPHPLWGGSRIRLWQPALVPHPVAPVFGEGAAAAAVEAVLGHLRAARLEGLALDGATLRALREDARFLVEGRQRASAIPKTQFVGVGATVDIGDGTGRIERVTAPEAMRDAVERFLLADARRSRAALLHDPAAAATVRVATRLLARRGLVEVELGYDDGEGREPVSGAIRLGLQGARVLWRRIGLDHAPSARPQIAEVDVSVMIAARAAPPRARPRLVAAPG